MAQSENKTATKTTKKKEKLSTTKYEELLNEISGQLKSIESPETYSPYLQDFIDFANAMVDSPYEKFSKISARYAKEIPELRGLRKRLINDNEKLEKEAKTVEQTLIDLRKKIKEEETKYIKNIDDYEERLKERRELLSEQEKLIEEKNKSMAMRENQLLNMEKTIKKKEQEIDTKTQEDKRILEKIEQEKKQTVAEKKSLDARKANILPELQNLERKRSEFNIMKINAEKHQKEIEEQKRIVMEQTKSMESKNFKLVQEINSAAKEKNSLDNYSRSLRNKEESLKKKEEEIEAISKTQRSFARKLEERYGLSGVSDFVRDNKEMVLHSSMYHDLLRGTKCLIITMKKFNINDKEIANALIDVNNEDVLKELKKLV